MPGSFTIGVDVGTYGSKGVLVDQRGQIVATAQRAHDLQVPRPGWAEHDAERDWWGDVRDILRELIHTSAAPPERIAAVGLSALGPCLVPVDRRGAPLSNAILYGIDTRATEEIEELTRQHGEEALLARCGNALSTQSVGPKLLWLRRNEPDVFASAHRFFTSTSFLVHRLTGASVVDHYTASSFTPLYDVQRQAWAPDLAEGIVDLERLGDVRWTCEPAGRVNHAASAETGLAEGTPVIVGTVDAAAEAVSAGVAAPGDMMLMYGTTLFMIEVLEAPKRDARLWSAPFLFPGTHALMAGMATTGALTRWLRDHFALELLAAEQDGGVNTYAALAKEAGSSPVGSDGMVVLPYFSGERTPIQDPHAKGVMFGLTLAHTRGHLYRALLESVGYGIRHHLDVLDELGVAPDRLVAVGGGTQQALWLQTVSDATGRSQQVPEVTIGAAYGDAMLARQAVAGADSVSDWVRIARNVEPAPEARSAHDRNYRIYRELYERTRDLMRVPQGHDAPGS